MKRLFKIFKSLVIGLTAIFLVTIGIDAADHYDNYSGSLAYKMIYGQPAGPCPSDMVFVSTDKGGFCIDKFENSVNDSCPVPSPKSQDETRNNIDADGCNSVSIVNAIPWTNVSQTQAAQICAKAGKRLPSNDEWYQAALGTPDVTSGWGTDDCQVASNWEAQPGRTGSGKKCLSPSGAYDMIGNVWEWVRAEISDGLYQGKKMPDSGYIKAVDINGVPITTDSNPDPNYNLDYLWIKDKGLRGMARGGYWDNKGDAGQFSVYLVSPPNFVGPGIGFRCAK